MRCGDDPAGAPGRKTPSRRARRSFASRRAGRRMPAALRLSAPKCPSRRRAGGRRAALRHRARDARRTLEHTRQAFAARGLGGRLGARDRAVVQPGVEFGDSVVFGYDRQGRQLSRNLPAHPGMVYEAHSTDYQTASARARWWRITSPSQSRAVAHLCLPRSRFRPGSPRARMARRALGVPEALEAAMLANPAHWKGVLSGRRARAALRPAVQFQTTAAAITGPNRRCAPNSTPGGQSHRRAAAAHPADQYLPPQYERVCEGHVSKTTPVNSSGTAARVSLRPTPLRLPLKRRRAPRHRPKYAYRGLDSG